LLALLLRVCASRRRIADLETAPHFRFDSLPPATIPNVMIAKFRFMNLKIVLEETKLEDVRARLGERLAATATPETHSVGFVIEEATRTEPGFCG